MFALMALAASAAPVVATMTEIAAYERLEEGDLTLVDLPSDLRHPQQIDDMAWAIGRIALEPLFPGEPLRRERLGSEVREVLMGDADDLVLVKLPGPEHWEPGRVDLAALRPDGACLLAQNLRSHGTAEPGLLAVTAPAAEALWLRAALSGQPVVALGRNPIDDGTKPRLACAQRRAISSIDIPTGLGVIVTLPGPAAAVHVSHPERVQGEVLADTDVLWLHGVTTGRAGVSVSLDGRPRPMIFDVRVDPGDGPAQPVPPGGYAELRAESPVLAAYVFPPGAVETQVVGERLLVFGRTEGLVEVAAVHPEGIALHTLEVLPGWPTLARNEPVLAMKPGMRRKVTAEGGVTEAWSADSEVATVALKRGRVKVTAVAFGTTEVVVKGADGRLTHVRVVVPEG